MTPENLFEQFLQAGLYLKGWSPRTPGLYRQAFRSYSRFQQSLRQDANGDDEVLNPTKAQLEAWVVWMRKSGKTASGCNIYIRIANSYCAWLKEQGHLREQVKLGQLKSHPKPVRVLSDAEMRLLLSSRPKRLLHLRTWTLITLMLDTGCRIDELLRLERSSVDFDNLLLTVNGKGEKLRKVPFSVEGRRHLWTFLQKWDRRYASSALLFCTSRETALRYRNTHRDIKACFIKAGVSGAHVHPHNTRHTFSCNYVKRGGSVVALSRILGHSSITTTQAYLRGLQIEDFGEARHLSPLLPHRT